MRLDLAERLRCPRPHAPTPLVVVASRVVERELLRGVAGCPLCRFEARFEEGDLLGDQATRAAAEDLAHAPDALDRLIALLGLAEPGGAVLLTGEYTAFAMPLAERCGVVVATDRPRVRRTLEEPVSAVLGFGEMLPFTDGTFRAAALGASTTVVAAGDAVRCTTRGGRIVGAARLDLPRAARELARDEREWVAEVVAPVAVFPIGRAPIRP